MGKTERAVRIKERIGCKSLFFQVFPTIQLKDETRERMEYASVSRVTVNRQKTQLHIYLESGRLIHKKYIFETEQAIHDQLFSDVLMNIRIIEKFRLSRQYTARNLMEVYEESILQELRAYNVFLHNLLSEAKKEFLDDDTLKITFQDSVIADGHQEELLRILEKIFCERCGMSLKIQAEREPAGKASLRELHDRELEQEVAAITEKYRSVKHEEQQRQEEGQEAEKKEAFLNGGADRKRKRKRPAREKMPVPEPKSLLHPENGTALPDVRIIRMWYTAGILKENRHGLNRSQARSAR